MAEYIKEDYSLNTGRQKINEVLTDNANTASEANTIAKNAETTATQALTNSNDTQTQLDNIVIEGDSSVEAAQARYNSVSDTNYTTLVDRLDTEYSEVTSELTNKASQEQLELKADKSNVLTDFQTKKAITGSSTPLKSYLVDLRMDEEDLGTVPTGWTEVSGTAKITDQNIIHGKHALLIKDTQSDLLDSAYYDFPSINEDCDFFIAVKPMVSETFNFYLSNGARDSSTNVVAFRVTSLYKLEIYDGATSSWLATSVGSQGSVIGIKVKNINFTNFTFEVDVNNGSFTQTEIGFQSNQTQINRLTFYLQNINNEVITDFISIEKSGGKKGYVFGDSVTRGYGYGDLNPDGSDAFINQYMTTYNPKTTWTRNEDGGGTTGITKWALAELENRASGMDYVIFAFGLHSVKLFDDYGIPTLETFLYQYRQLIRKAKDLKIEPIGWVMPRRGDVDFNTQLEWAKAQKDVCIQEGVLCINAWDALDLNPFNEEFEDQDLTLYHTDTIHPITAGHTKIAEAVYKAIGTL